MRIGNNPNKDQRNEQSTYRHQIIIPVYIPNLEGYFKDSYSYTGAGFSTNYIVSNTLYKDESFYLFGH